MAILTKGFAHGFLVLSDEAVFNYKCTDFYSLEYDLTAPYSVYGKTKLLGENYVN